MTDVRRNPAAIDSLTLISIMSSIAIETRE